jgi:hypothetical protein
MKILITTLKIILSLGFLSLFLQCSFGKTQDTLAPDSPGYRITVDYGEQKETYFWQSSLSHVDLMDALAEFSLREDPSMRFITTNQTIEIYDILGTRNSYTHGWKIYLDGELLSPERLKKGVKISQSTKVLIQYASVQRLLYQKNSKSKF